MLEVSKKKKTNPKLKAYWAARRAAQAARLPPEEAQWKDRHRKYHNTWLASLTPEELKQRAEGRRERARQRKKMAVKKKPPSAKTRA